MIRKQSKTSSIVGGGFSPVKPAVPTSQRKLSVRELFDVQQKIGRLCLEEDQSRNVLVSQEHVHFDNHLRGFLLRNFEVITEPLQRHLIHDEESLDHELLRKQRKAQHEAICSSLQEVRQEAFECATVDIRQQDPIYRRSMRQMNNTRNYEETVKAEKIAEQVAQVEAARVKAHKDVRAKSKLEMEGLELEISCLDAQIQAERHNQRAVIRLTAERAGKRRDLERLRELHEQWAEHDEKERQRLERMKKLRISVEAVGKKSIIVKSMEKSLQLKQEQEQELIDENMRRMLAHSTSTSSLHLPGVAGNNNLSGTRTERSASQTLSPGKSDLGQLSPRSPGYGDLVATSEEAKAAAGRSPRGSKSVLPELLSPRSRPHIMVKASTTSKASPTANTSKRGGGGASPAAAATSDEDDASSPPLTSRRSRKQQALVSPST